MNPEHVSVEDRRPQTSFPVIPSTQGSLVCRTRCTYGFVMASFSVPNDKAQRPRLSGVRWSALLAAEFLH
jgi:hypothetical protein